MIPIVKSVKRNLVQCTMYLTSSLEKLCQANCASLIHRKVDQCSCVSVIVHAGAAYDGVICVCSSMVYVCPVVVLWQ